MNNRNKVRYITQAAIIAALYTVLTYFSNLLGLASGAIQLRLSEALLVCVFFTPAAVPGLVIGCLLSNLLTGAVITDIIFGSLATLIGSMLGHRLRRNKHLLFLPNIAANTIIIPLVLVYAYGVGEAWWYLAITVGVGEIISCGILGSILLSALKKRGVFYG